MTDGSEVLSSSISVSYASISEDDSAFSCELADRLTGRTQNVIRGTITLKNTYLASGLKCDFQKKISRFPCGSYRVILQMDTTCTYYGIYNHTTKKILVYNALGTEETAGVSVNNLVFPFLAVGE